MEKEGHMNTLEEYYSYNKMKNDQINDKYSSE